MIPSEVSSSRIVFFQKSLISWFSGFGRTFPWRKTGISNYRKIVSEVLLQRTRAETVARFFDAFVRTYPEWKTLAEAGERELGEYLKPIGLWRRKAANLNALSRVMAQRGGRFPVTRDEVESLPAVGQYIANSILLFVHGEAQPLLDVNMARVLERFFGPRNLVDIRHDTYLQDLSRQVLQGIDPIKMNWAILDFAAMICKARNPACITCPLADSCQYFRSLGSDQAK